jgi:hypothetical protein
MMLEKMLESPAFGNMLAMLITAICGYFVTYVSKKKQALQQEMDNELVTKYTDMIEQTIRDCVAATNQTFVEALKKQGAFTEEAQMEAFAQTYNNVMAILSEDCYEYLTMIATDVEVYITNKIEAEVNFAKM